MAIIQDAFNPVNYQAGVSAANPADEPQSSEIVRGLRGGANSFMSGMNNAMGGVAQPMGFEDFAQGRFKAGREYEEQAQREGPSVASLRDVHGVGDAARFVMGQTGQMAIPMAIGVGSGLLTKSPGKGLAAATAAMTPETFGHAVGEYRHTNNDAPVDQNTALRLGGTAVASSAIQNIVPAGVGSMLRGGGAAANTARGFMPTMGRAVATDIGGNAVASGAADMLTQKGVNPDRQIDVARSLDAAATGGVMGVPFVGAHAVGYGIHSAPRAGVDAAVTGTKSIKDRLKEKLGAVVGADPAPEKAKPVDHVDSLNEITSRAEDPMTETMAAGGRPDPTLEATAEGQAKNDATAFEWAKTKGEELMKSTGLTKANYDSLAQAMQDPANPAAQKTIALITQGVEKAKGFGKTVADMARALDTHMVKSADEAKKSEDYSGTRAAISEHVVPWLEANKPEVLGDPVQINAVADGVRRFMDFATKNRDAPIPTEISSAMNRLFDGDVGLLSKLHEAVIGDADAAKSANYVNTVKELARDQARSKTFEEFIGHSMTDGAFSARQVPLVADRLIAWANEKHPAGKSDGEKAALSAQAELKNLEMEQYMRLKFGDKADAVEQALKAHVTKSRDEYAQQAVKKAPLESDGEYSGPPAEEALDRIIHKKDAKSKAPDAVMDPALFDSSKQAGLNYGKQQLADAKAKYPDHDVRWVSGDDLTKMTGQTHEGGKDHGHIVAEKAADPERITPAELKTMQLDAKRHNTSKSRIDAKTSDGKPLILDAVGITQAMLAKLPKVEGETYADREKRAFLSGAAELMREHGKFEIKPETVISYSGGGATKFGEINKLGKSGTEDRMSKSGQEKLAALRENYKEATSVEKKDILKEVQKLHEFEKDRELSNDPNDARPSTNFDDKGNLSSEGARALLESAGRMEVGADDHLRVSSAALGDKGVEVRSNMDGTPRSTATRSKNDHVAAVADMAHELKAKTNPGAQALGAKLEALSKIMKHLPDAAQEDLMIASGRKMPMSERMALVNPLAEKYKDKTEADFTKTDAPKTIATKPLNTLAAPESILAKQIDKRQEYLNNPPENYSAEVAKGHIDWAARQLERVDAEYEKAKGNQDRQDQLSDYRGALKRLMTKAKSVLEGDASLAEKEGTPDPKSVAAKKAALVERAASGDKDLIKELSTSTDAKGLQRAAEVLAESAPESKALAAANERLAMLVKDPDTAYGLQTKKYSLMGARVHEELGREGFAATHDSPIRHEGKFDWRAHQGKGEGNASFGAGTYLSTADGVHKSYKEQFSKFDSRLAQHHRELMDLANAALAKFGKRSPEYVAAEQRRAAAEQASLAPPDELSASPTYETSVNIKPEQLLDWDKPLSEQDESVQKALRGAGADGTITQWHISIDDMRRTNYISGSFRILREKTGGFELYASDGALLGEFLELSAAKAKAQKYPVLGSDIYSQLTGKLGSQSKASDYLQSLGILGHKYAADGGKNDTHPNYVIYDDSKISTNYVHFDKTSAGVGPKRPTDFQAAKDYLTTATPWVKTMLANLSHAGEFTRLGAHDIIRLSTHALNPLSTAYHESLHAFFAKLSDAGAHDVMDVLNKAAASPHVMKQLREFLKNEPAALKQLSDPEERAAYMYQMHALGELKLPPAATTIMGKIKAMLMKALGMWTNDARALHIMDYFQTGEYAQSMGNPSAVHRAMMDKGRNKAVEKLTEMAKPLSDLGMAVVGIGSQRLRDTGIPALREVADLVKATGREDHNDKGYLPTARDERATRMNDISSKLEGYTPEQLGDALGSMQRGVEAKTAEGRTVQTAVQKSLADTLKYMRSAGVNIEHIGAKDGVPYFPRVWDTDYISKNKADFLNMLSKYERRGLISDSQSILSKMIARDGNEFGVESREPGMQFKKQRVLSMIDHVDAAEFMSKDLFQTLNSYITQATRRAEWSRRFADDGSTLDGLLAKAREQGAEDKHIDMTEQYLKGVDGTLGDSLDPTYRRLMGDVIVYQNIRLLPLAIFSSVVDPIGLMINGASAKDAWSTFKRGIREVPLGFKDQSKHAKDHWTEMAETLGVIDNATLHQSIGALYNQGMVGGTAQKINDTFFKLNLMEQYNRSMRIGATEAATRFIAKHAVEGESVHSTRWLAELGLKASDVKMHEGALALTEAHGLSKAEADKMRSAVNQWVDGAILRPDAADKPIWMNDPRWMLISHLKQFVYSFHQTILKKVGHEFTHGNHAPIMAMASYVPIMIAADMMKGMIQGAGSQPDFKEGWGFGDYIWSGLQRAGLFGVGQFGLDVATDVQRGGVGIGALAGPTLGQMGDALELMGGHKQFAPFALHAMPANALYSGIVKGGAQADPMFAD